MTKYRILTSSKEGYFNIQYKKYWYSPWRYFKERQYSMWFYLPFNSIKDAEAYIDYCKKEDKYKSENPKVIKYL